MGILVLRLLMCSFAAVLVMGLFPLWLEVRGRMATINIRRIQGRWGGKCCGANRVGWASTASAELPTMSAHANPVDFWANDAVVLFPIGCRPAAAVSVPAASREGRAAMGVKRPKQAK